MALRRFTERSCRRRRRTDVIALLPIAGSA
jgi:hypothetical protein